MKANEIIEKTIEKYARCRSYSDSGLVEHDFPDFVSIRFRTTFRRSPSHFTFEWQDFGAHWGKTEEFSCLRYTNGDAETIHRRGGREFLDFFPLSLAIQDASDASLSSASVISGLLFDDVGSGFILRMKNPELLSVHDSDECFVLKEIDNEGFPSTDKIWISRSDFTIRKYENSFGQTAEEIEDQLQKLEADAAASGLRPPRRDVEYHPMKSTTRYIYETVEFDAPILK